MAKQVYIPPAIVAEVDDLHLRDLLELKCIAAGTPKEAYTWPKLLRRLNEMIAERQAVIAHKDKGDV